MKNRLKNSQNLLANKLKGPASRLVFYFKTSAILINNLIECPIPQGGSADKAGLKAGDKILKVNGKAVSDLTHMEVVEMIKSDGQVVLTVQQHPLHRPPVVPSSPPGIGVAAKRKGNNSRENITGPQPVDVSR